MADDLPDAPWATGGGSDLPDAPWAAASPQKAIPPRGIFPQMAGEKLAQEPHDTSIFGTAIPKRADTYGERVKDTFGQAVERIKGAAKDLYGTNRDLREGPGFPGARQVGMAGDIATIATEAASAAASPLTAAIYPTIEKYTGIPGEDVAGAVLGGAGARGVRAPNTSFLRERPPGPSAPSAPSALSPEFRAGQETAAAPPPPAEGPQGPTVAQPRAGLEPDVRLLPPDLPVGEPVRDSVGAARATSALEQASPEAVRILENVARDEGWTEHTLDQLEGEQSPHHFLAESSENMEQLAKANQTLPGAARTETNQAVQQRHRERGERVNAIHDEYLGQDVDRTTWDAAMKRAAQQESAPFWQQFDRQVITPTPEIEAVLQRPGMRRALAAANDTLLNRGLPIEQGFPFLGEEEAATFGDNAGRTAAERDAAQTRVPTARAFQLAKMQLDKRIADAVRGGHSTDIGTYTTLKRDLDTAIAAHPNQEIAQLWQQARQTYRGSMSLINAREIGEGLLGGKTHYTEVPGILEDMGPEQRAALQLGLRNHMADVAGHPGASAQLRNIRELLGPDNQRKLASVIGPERAEAYVGALQQEEHMHFAPGRLTKGSDTAANLAFQKLLQPPETRTALSRAAGVAGDLLHPKAAVLRKGMEMLEAGNEAAAGREMQRWQGIRADLGRLLTTQGPERDAIRRAIVQRIQEGEGGLAGPVGRQPLTPQVLERGRSGRPTKRTPLPIGTENEILERGARKVEEGAAPPSSPDRQIGEVLKQLPALRQAYNDVPPGRERDALGTYITAMRRAGAKRQLAVEGEQVTQGGRPLEAPQTHEPGSQEHALQEHAWVEPHEALQKAAKQLPKLEGMNLGEHAGALRAAIDATKEAASARNIVPERQGMSFGEMKRRDFLKGIAATGIAAAKPEVIIPALKRVGMGERLVDAAAPRALARQAIYSFGEDKVQALNYLYENARDAKPGSPIEKAYRAAVRHITSGDIDKEPGIWAKSVAELRAYDDTVRAGQAARRAGEEGLRGRGELPGGEGELEAPRGTDREAGEPEPPLSGLPTKVTVPGLGKIEVGPHQPIRDLAHQYMADAGLPYNPPKDYAKVDPARARRIADEYEKMPHAPDDPEVKTAYEAMAKETMAQWNAIKKAGFKAEFIPPGSPDPYAASPRLAVEDIKKNNHMWVFSTRDGFGTLEGFDPRSSPLLADTGEVISGQPALVNDIFRIVHDYFGHAKEGVGFRADGEENAWRSHSAMYSPLARKAMTSETRGQNSWLNYGPYGDANRTAKTEGTVFADQKTGIMPDWVVSEGSGLPLVRNVLERGRSGRPTKTVPIPTGTENQILQAGFERSRGPTFYSGVERAVDAAKQTKAPAQQWLGTIKNAPGVKPEELQWLGLEDWLKQQKGSVTKDEIADYVRANQIEVKEVEHGRPVDADMLKQLETERSNLRPQLDDARRQISTAPDRNAATAEVARLNDRYDEIGRQIRDAFRASPTTKFASHQLPGSENYRELLLTLPREMNNRIDAVQKQIDDFAPIFDHGNVTQAERDRYAELTREKARLQSEPQSNFQSSHFDEPNILAHVRFNDRTIDGKKTLFVEEVQSDWHQKGKKEGYTRGDKLPEGYELKEYPWPGTWSVYDPRGAIVAQGGDRATAIANARGLAGSRLGVPDAPFKTTWPELAMKRMVRYAAENGYDKVAWTTGETQAARYDLSKQIDELHYNPGTHRLIAKKGDKRVLDEQSVPPAKLPDHIGKEAADKIMQQEPNVNGLRSLKGLDLKVGGEGMKGFYDQILPATVNKLVKKFGAKVGKDEIDARAKDANGMRLKFDEPTTPVHSVDITPRLRESTFVHGLPQFASGGAVKPSMRTRQQSNYSPTRGTEKRHCGPDKQWPEAYCSMFRGPHGCTAVGGFIVPRGGCDWFCDHRAERPKRADGGSTFRDRLPEAEGLIEDRRDDPPMPEMSRLHGTMVRLGLPTEQPEAKPGAGISGRMQFDAGITDIARHRPKRQFGGAMQGAPWQSMMSSPWFQRMMQGRQAGNNRSQFQGAAPWTGTPAGMINQPPNPPATSAPSGIMAPPNPPAAIGAPPVPGVSMQPPNPPVISNLGSAAPPSPPPAGPQVGPTSGMAQRGIPGAGPMPYKRGGAVNHVPTDAQKEAGNYAKEHIKVHGLDISIENKRGSTRSGKSKDGKTWSVKMPAHYGYLRRTEGADGDHVDCYIGPHLKSDKVFVIDQRDADTKRWDEHKCMIGFGSSAQAKAYYKRGFSDGRGHLRIGSIREMTIEQFKEWLKGDTTKPAAKAA
jgi:hypothetical protein